MYIGFTTEGVRAPDMRWYGYRCRAVAGKKPNSIIVFFVIVARSSVKFHAFANNTKFRKDHLF